MLFQRVEKTVGFSLPKPFVHVHVEGVVEVGGVHHPGGLHGCWWADHHLVRGASVAI